MNHPDADVIIAGAGPAGSIAAYELATQGIKVLILEKSNFPRYKVCGGGLTHKIINEIPFDVSKVIESTIHTVQFSNNFKNAFTRTSENPLIYCTMRDRLDDLLLREAINAGAEIDFQQQVIAINYEHNGVIVSTKSGFYKARLIIGADGASSIVARSRGLRRNIEQGLAWEAEIFTDPCILAKYSDTVFLDWGTFLGGYGWVFPKKDHFSIGVGGPARLSKQMIPYYYKFLEYIDLGDSRHPALGTRYSVTDSENREPRTKNRVPSTEYQVPRTLSLKSWPIPVRTKKGNFHADRAIVVGDAAGLTDSLTGEGIYYAIRSGKIAAVSCQSFLNGETTSLKSYSDRVNDELMTELLEGNKIKHIFNTVPSKIHCFVRDSDRAWRAFGKVLRGERSYKDVKLGFGKWRFFWNLAAFLSGFLEKWKQNQYRGNFNNIESNPTIMKSESSL